MKITQKYFYHILIFIVFSFIFFSYQLLGDKQDILIYSSDETAEIYFDNEYVGKGVVCMQALKGSYSIQIKDLDAEIKVLDNTIRVKNFDPEYPNKTTFVQRISNELSDIYLAPVDCDTWTFAGVSQYIFDRRFKK